MCVRMCVCVYEGRESGRSALHERLKSRLGNTSTHSVVTIVARGFVHNEQYQSHDEA